MPNARRWLEHDADLRASHAERDEVVEALIAHWSDGRLDEATFDERAARARSAVMRRDLAVLLRDLPPLAPTAPPAVRTRHGRPRRRMGVLRATLTVVLAVVVLQAVVAATFHAPNGVPWVPVALVAWLVLRSRPRHRRRLHA